MKRNLQVKCLVLDHDDTVVKSTPGINFPAFCRALSILRPEVELSYEKFVEMNFSPGFYPMCTDIFHMTEEEIAFQEQCWKEDSAKKIPDVYEGLPEILNRYVENGGIICVSSHSLRKTILRDYRVLGMPTPSQIFDWECPRRKPDPFALQEIMRIYDFSPKELLMVDDLKPGYDMASSCGVPFACAGWSDNQIPMIRNFMQQYGDFYLMNTRELEELLYV